MGFPLRSGAVAGLREDVDGRVDALYCLPLERFVPERDALVRSLRGEKRRDEAAAVAKLPKPALAAWAVNQVVRSQAAAARALWEAGDAVLDVQDQVVAGRAGGDDLRDAIAAQRAALAPLADAARGMLTARGAFLGEQAVQAVIETLHAAAGDRAARPDVEAGRLAKPLRLAGLGALPAAAPRRRGGDAEEGPAAGAEEASAAEEAEESRSAAAERASREEERRRERELAAARRALERAVKARDSALERVERRRLELEAAEEELARLEEDVRAAEEALEE